LPAVALIAVAGFVGYGVVGLYLMRRGGLARMAGFGLLFPWILFFTEFVTIRFQEPFVLYRSYLWAPGFMVVLASGLARVPVRVAGAAALLVLPLLFYQAHHRLNTFSSNLALWEDAVAKLPRRAVPGGSRTFYHLGREYLYQNRGERAIAVAERCLAEYPATYDCHMARASIHLHLEEYRNHLAKCAAALGTGTARHHRGRWRMGCLDEASKDGCAESGVRWRRPPLEPPRHARQRTPAAGQAQGALGRVRRAAACGRWATATLSRGTPGPVRALSSDC
jgi:tetratricopeptide (TPR) repeat protein